MLTHVSNLTVASLRDKAAECLVSVVSLITVKCELFHLPSDLICLVMSVATVLYKRMSMGLG